MSVEYVLDIKGVRVTLTQDGYRSDDAEFAEYLSTVKQTQVVFDTLPPLATTVDNLKRIYGDELQIVAINGEPDEPSRIY